MDLSNTSNNIIFVTDDEERLIITSDGRFIAMGQEIKDIDNLYEEMKAFLSEANNKY